MIECKTRGKEYKKYVKETFTHKNKSKENDGGQIFTYLQQEPKATKVVCYYASRITGNSLEYKNAIIHNKEDWADLNQEERFNHWSKTFETIKILVPDIEEQKIVVATVLPLEAEIAKFPKELDEIPARK